MRPEPFEIARVPRMDLTRGPVTVDIGYLGGEPHREAFASLFGKMLADNAGLLADTQLTRVDAARTIQEMPGLPIAARELIASPARLALTLYDSRNDSVRLEFSGAGRVFGIGVRFDNPEFWLEHANPHRG